MYVSHERTQEYRRDTILVREHDVEVRYRLHRDTVESVKLEVIRDSIPYPVEDIRQVPRPRSWFDVLSYCALGILLAYFGIKLVSGVNNFSKNLKPPA